MTIKKLLPSLLLSLTLFAPAHPSMAQDVREKLDNDVLTQMQSEGWRIVKNGVLQRELRAGEVESFVFGSDGFTWKLQDLRGRLRKMQSEFKAHPTPELRQAIAGYRKEIASTQKMIERARAAEALGETSIDKVSCALNFAYDAGASYGASVQGTYGSASANFTGSCGFTGEVYATAYSKVTVNGAPTTKTVTDGPRAGANVSASAYASLNGGSPCESSAYASMTSSSVNPSSYSISASNTQCPFTITSPSVTINGTSYIYSASCVTTTWTSSVTGGTSPYTYQWTWNGVNVGTGSSYSRTTCPGGGYSYTTNTLGLTVTDSGARTGSASKSVDVEKDPQPMCGQYIC